MLYALMIFIEYAIFAAIATSFFWFIVIRFGDTADLDQRSVIVRWFSKRKSIGVESTASQNEPLEMGQCAAAEAILKNVPSVELRSGTPDVTAELKWLRSAVEDLQVEFTKSEEKKQISEWTKEWLSNPTEAAPQAEPPWRAIQSRKQFPKARRLAKSPQLLWESEFDRESRPN